MLPSNASEMQKVALCTDAEPEGNPWPPTPRLQVIKGMDNAVEGRGHSPLIVPKPVTIRMKEPNPLNHKGAILTTRKML